MDPVAQFYDENVIREWERLDRHRIVFAVTLRALAEYLPPLPAAVLDVGGGPGRYAHALAQQGYTVTLMDLSAGCLAFARQKARETGVALAGYVHGNATDLSMFPDATQDAVLSMGPLYHLPAEEDRQRAVREVHRVLQLGGVVFASYMIRYSVIRHAAGHDPTLLFTERQAIEDVLSTGVSGQPAEAHHFTDAYFAHPTEIAPFMEAAGFRTLTLVSVEGVIDRIDDQVNTLTGDLWETWADLNYRLGKDPSVHGCAQHLMYIGQKT